MDHLAWSNETKSAYLACALDTDGWITIIRMKRADDGSFRLYPNVGVTNQSTEFLSRLGDIAGQVIRIGTNARGGVDQRAIVTRRPVYQIHWRSPAHVVPVLEMALPYLVAKREQAEIVLEFARSRMTPTGKVHRSSAPYTERTWSLYEAVAALNRGPNVHH